MNSDQIQTQEPEQEPAVEALGISDEQNSADVEATDNIQESDAIVELDATALDNTAKESFVESELKSAAVEPDAEPESNAKAELEQRVAQLQNQEQSLKQEIAVLRQEIAALQTSYNKTLQDQLAQTQASLARLLQESLSDLEQRKQTLQIAVEQLERRRERIREEMRKSFAGVSQDLAIRVQGFKDYLVGSLQDLAVTAEQLDLVKVQEPEKSAVVEETKVAAPPPTPKFAEQGFQSTAKQVRSMLDQYRTRPDYYGPPWQLRRTFEPVHAERVSNWFFTQGGRGAIRTMGSRLQNILIASAIISVLSTLYGDRQRTLILVNTPELLGEWRRGLQDCLGISRSDFGPEQGIVLFEAPEPLVQKADRLVAKGQLPLIAIDETENQIDLSLLQFPLWLAFAPDPQQMISSSDFRF